MSHSYKTVGSISKKKFDLIIVGAGPAGIGVGILLKKLKFNNFLIIEKDEIASSFRNWPEETRFISPSFTGNFFGAVDLNSISPETSPAFTLSTEHPSGKEYALYLTKLAKHFDLPIKTHVEVKEVKKNRKNFKITTYEGTYSSQILVWAAGEFSYPKTPKFDGAEHCIHYKEIQSFQDIQGQDVVVIGGNEGGMDALTELSRLGKNVTLIDRNEPWDLKTSDSSISLSPYTLDRLKNVFPEEAPLLIGNQDVTKVAKKNDGYYVYTSNDECYLSDTEPILTTGFVGSTSLIKNLFDWDSGNVKPNLSTVDESTKTPGLFLIGPEVRHSNVIFCFIYKFRQRFPIVAEAIFERLGKEYLLPDEYKKDGVYLEDLSCCLNECSC